MPEPERQVERYARSGGRVMKVMFEGFKCERNHLFLEEFIRYDGSGNNMCLHCDSTKLIKSTILDPDAEVPGNVLEFFRQHPEAGDSLENCGGCEHCIPASCEN